MKLSSYIMIFAMFPLLLNTQVNKDITYINSSVVRNVSIESVEKTDEETQQLEQEQNGDEEIKEETEVSQEQNTETNQETETEKQSDSQQEIQIEDKVVQENETIQEVEETIKEVINIFKFNVDSLVLKKGRASEEILRIKKFLKIKGYTNITENYYFDSKTKDAVIKYQKDNGLVANGIIDSSIFKKINEDMEINRISISEIEMVFLADVPKSDWILINKSNNTLYHLRGKEIIKKYPIATGKEANLTPEGKFNILVKLVNPAWGGAGKYKPVKGGAPNNPLGTRWMGLSIKGGGSYGIHGNSDKESIGQYASLGCIRMFNKDVELLFNLIKKGTPVWIGSETKLKEFGIVFR